MTYMLLRLGPDGADWTVRTAGLGTGPGLASAGGTYFNYHLHLSPSFPFFFTSPGRFPLNCSPAKTPGSPARRHGSCHRTNPSSHDTSSSAPQLMCAAWLPSLKFASAGSLRMPCAASAAPMSAPGMLLPRGCAYVALTLSSSAAVWRGCSRSGLLPTHRPRVWAVPSPDMPQAPDRTYR